MFYLWFSVSGLSTEGFRHKVCLRKLHGKRRAAIASSDDCGDGTRSTSDRGLVQRQRKMRWLWGLGFAFKLCGSGCSVQGSMSTRDIEAGATNQIVRLLHASIGFALDTIGSNPQLPANGSLDLRISLRTNIQARGPCLCWFFGS